MAKAAEKVASSSGVRSSLLLCAFAAALFCAPSSAPAAFAAALAASAAAAPARWLARERCGSEQ